MEGEAENEGDGLCHGKPLPLKAGSVFGAPRTDSPTDKKKTSGGCRKAGREVRPFLFHVFLGFLGRSRRVASGSFGIV